MKKTYVVSLIGIVIISVGVASFAFRGRSDQSLENNQLVNKIFQINEGGPEAKLHPLAIESLRQREYPGSDIVIEQELAYL